MSNLKIKSCLKEMSFWALIAPIFIFAALIVHYFYSEIDQQSVAKYIKVKKDIESLTISLSGYYQIKGKLPDNLALLIAPPDLETPEPWQFTNIPKDPWGNPYNYTVESVDGVEKYKLWTYGRDGKPGGEGENMDLSNFTDWH